MDFHTARRMKHYRELSQRAWATHTRALDDGDISAGLKAARLIERVECRMDGVAFSEVRTYSERAA